MNNTRKLFTTESTGTTSHTTIFTGHINITNRLILMIMIERVFSY